MALPSTLFAPVSGSKMATRTLPTVALDGGEAAGGPSGGGVTGAGGAVAAAGGSAVASACGVDDIPGKVALQAESASAERSSHAAAARRRGQENRRREGRTTRYLHGTVRRQRAA